MIGLLLSLGDFLKKKFRYYLFIFVLLVYCVVLTYLGVWRGSCPEIILVMDDTEMWLRKSINKPKVPEGRIQICSEVVTWSLGHKQLRINFFFMSLFSLTWACVLLRLKVPLINAPVMNEEDMNWTKQSSLYFSQMTFSYNDVVFLWKKKKKVLGHSGDANHKFCYIWDPSESAYMSI